MRDIKIKAVLNGWIVTIGCQKVVFKSLDKLCDELRAYYADPEGVEKRYLEKYAKPSNSVERNREWRVIGSPFTTLSVGVDHAES